MRCEEAYPLISELYDRELVPRQAAEHIFGCSRCRARLRDYAEIGAELRLLASQAASAEPLPQLQPAPRRSRWVRRWSAPVLVPRYVAVPMLIAILVLSIGLGLVQAQRSAEAANQEFQQALTHGDVAKVTAMLQKNPALANTCNDRDMMPLHVVSAWVVDDAAATQIAKLLVAAGADVNARSFSKQTPLHVAITYGRQEIVALLVEHGADLNARDWKGMTPLDRAAQARDPHLAGLLRAKGAKLDIFSAAELGETKTVSELLSRDVSLLNARDPEGRSPLEIAATKRHSQLVQLLLSYQPQMDIFLAATAGQLSLVEKFLRENPRLVNAENERGMTPLYCAVLGGHKEIAESLLARGAKVSRGRRWVLEGPLLDNRRIWWTTPLHEAAFNGDLELALVLLRHGADPLAHSYSGATPYHLALMNGHEKLAEELLRFRRIAK